MTKLTYTVYSSALPVLLAHLLLAFKRKIRSRHVCVSEVERIDKHNLNFIEIYQLTYMQLTGS